MGWWGSLRVSRCCLGVRGECGALVLFDHPDDLPVALVRACVRAEALGGVPDVVRVVGCAGYQGEGEAAGGAVHSPS